MPRDTKFSETWISSERKDKNGDLISSWCRVCPEDKFAGFCKVCNKKFSVANMGFSQLISHATSSKHQQRIKEKSNQSTFFIAENSSSQSVVNSGVLQISTSSSCKHWIPSSMQEKVLKAEAVILLTAIKCNYSFSSINELGNIFSTAFDDSEIAKHVKLGDAKARYVTKFGLAPYFRKRIYDDVISSATYFTLYFDETTTRQVKKQLDIYISYWSNKEAQIITSYCDSFFLGHAESDKILELILMFVSDNGLSIDNHPLISIR